MQLTSILVVSTTLLASQVPAQFIRSMVPNVPTWSGIAVPSSMATPSSSASLASHSFGPMHIAAQSSMSSVARPSSSQSIAPVATPSASSSFNTFNQNQGLRQPAAQHQGQTYAIPHGGLAPVDPLEPGSNVAPVLIQKPSGIDEGNSFCMGQCYASENEAQCDGPTSSPLYRPAYGCWMCCFTPGDF